MRTLRVATSDLLFITAALAVLGGWYLAFTSVGATLVVVGWGMAFAAFLLWSTWRRALVAGAVVTLILYYVGAIILIGLAWYEVRSRRRRQRVSA